MEKETINNDSLLWNNFLSGDEEAYSDIYKKYVQILFKYGLQFTTDRELVKDCIQDVFEKIHKNRNKLGQTDNIKLYLFVVLKNSLFNILKREKGRVQTIESMDNESDDPNDTAENQLIQKEENYRTEEKVKFIFSLLTPRQREAMYYRFVECMSINDIATIMDMNYQSIQNLIQRSIKKVRKGVEDG
ncbi:MAG: RNA polymerase sigma factor [Dysgonomonas sp.]